MNYTPIILGHQIPGIWPILNDTEIRDRFQNFININIISINPIYFELIRIDNNHTWEFTNQFSHGNFYLSNYQLIIINKHYQIKDIKVGFSLRTNNIIGVIESEDITIFITPRFYL